MNKRQPELKRYVDRIKNEPEIQNYSQEQMLSYLLLYETIRGNYFNWKDVPKRSISISFINKILEEYLYKNEKYFVNISFGLDSGNPKSFRYMAECLDLPYITVRNSTKDAIRKIQDMVSMSYISADLSRIIRKPKSIKWNGSVFDFTAPLRNILIRSFIDLDKLSRMDEKSLRKIRRIGDASIKEIREYFSKKGLEW